jgi:hypothetical protein
MYASRPAREGEIYVTTRFPSGSIGLSAPGEGATAVCVAFGARLRLENLPVEFQDMLGVAAVEDTVFTRLENGLHRDGVKFANGAEMPLHRLGAGVLVSLIDTESPAVMAISRQAPAEFEPAE